MSFKNLNSFNKNIFSQFGEDGIIEEIFNRLGKNSDKHCCEFGAWDGEYLSNVYNLILNKNFKGILIESDPEKFKNLLNKNNKNIIPINKLVSFEGKNKLDNILLEQNFEKNFDLLSIDIDGNDYHVFKEINEFKPKIIIIEYNPTIPNDVEFIQKKDLNINQGSSAKAIFNLAKQKNYFLIAATSTNLFFVHENYKELIVDKEYQLEEIRDDSSCRNYIFTGYDGKIFTSKKLHLKWHNLEIKEIKYLPKILQKIPLNFNKIEKFLFYLFKFYKYPITYFKRYSGPQIIYKKLKSIKNNETYSGNLSNYKMQNQDLTKKTNRSIKFSKIYTDIKKSLSKFKKLKEIKGLHKYHIEKNQLDQFLKKIFIYDCGHNLIRIGDNFDGGYLVPDILKKVKYCFSAGVGMNTSFEKNLKKMDIKCFLADGTIDYHPEGFDFIKKNINTYCDEKNITLHNWIDLKISDDLDNNLMLKMDIEGSEISAILNIQDEKLKHTNILVIEFHQFANLGNSFGLDTLNEVFDKILRYFTVCHIHPNNYGNIKNIYGIKMPNYMEFTFVNNNYVKYKKKNLKNYPLELDKKNFPEKKDILLPKELYE